MKRTWGIVSIAVAIFAVVALAISTVIELPPLVHGWFCFLLHNLPRISVNFAGVISGLVFVSLFLAVVHGCGASLCKSISGKSGCQHHWRFRWTLMVLGLVAVTFVSGLSAVGLARNLGWLAASRQPVYEERVSDHWED
jgi:hypothetical protein